MNILIRETDEELKALEAERNSAYQFEEHTLPHLGPVLERLRSLKDEYRWFIYNAETRVGDIQLWVERGRATCGVGFEVDHNYRNKGIATAALKQVVEFAFCVMGVHKICGDNDSDNPASGRVFEKSGFTNEAVLKDHVFKPTTGQYADIVHWARFNDSGDEVTPNLLFD